MNTISVSDFKQKCLELLDPEKLALEPLALTRHNRVVAIVCEPKHYFQDSPLKGSVTYNLQPGESLENIRFQDEWAS